MLGSSPRDPGAGCSSIKPCTWKVLPKFENLLVPLGTSIMDKPAHATNFSNSPTARPKVSNRVIEGAGGRILCVADIRGQFSHLNTLAVEAGAVAVIHTGDFGFFGMLFP